MLIFRNKNLFEKMHEHEFTIVCDLETHSPIINVFSPHYQPVEKNIQTRKNGSMARLRGGWSVPKAVDNF